MLIYLYGPDSYRRQQNLNKLATGFREKNTSFSEKYSDFAIDGNFPEFEDFLLQQSMFSFKKLAVVNNPFELGKDESSKFKEILKSNKDTPETFIILSSNEEPAKEFEFLLDLPKNNVLEFGALEGAKMEHYMNLEAKNLGISLTPKAVSLLAKIFRGNTWGLVTELQKLAFLKSHPESPDGDEGSHFYSEVLLRQLADQNDNLTSLKKIDVKDIEETLVYFADSDIRSLSSLISKNDSRKKIIPVLENLFFNNEEPAKIFNFISANPYLRPELVEGLANYDVAIKSGKLDYETALLDLTLSL